MPATEVTVHQPDTDTRNAPVAKRRLLSIDFYRGFTVAAMILVTDPGTYAHIYSQFTHEQWNGATLTDMIAPSFLFIVGVALSFSFSSRIRRGATRGRLAGHVLFRVAALVVLGLALNGFPDYDLHYLRIPGILQHIAVCLLIGGLLHCFSGRVSDSGKGDSTEFRANRWLLASAMVVLVAIDWVLMQWVPVPGYGAGHLDPFGNMGGLIDRTLFGTNHLWQWGNFWWDPDGMLTTLPASANLMLGILAGDLLQSSIGRLRTILIFAGGGLVLFAAGLMLDPIYPINKKIWTPSYTLLSGGFCLLALALSHWILDAPMSVNRERLLRRITAPARVFGANAILAFGFSTVITTLASRIHVTAVDGSQQAIPGAAYAVFAQFLEPRNASLLYALLIVLLNLLLLVPFHRKGLFVKL